MIFSGLSNKYRFLILLLIISVNIILPPFLEHFFETFIFFDILTTAILISTVFALNKNRTYVAISALLAAPLILSIWLARYTGVAVFTPVGLFFGIFFFIFTAFNILKFILSREYVTLEVIIGAVTVYLMLGIIWSICYGFIETLFPGSFNFMRQDGMIEPYSIIYFSFVTLTTLGYGDISPLTPVAQSLTLVEALVGQVYLVVLIAWLVGMHISEKKVNPHPGKLSSYDIE